MNQLPKKTLLLLFVFIVVVGLIGFVVWKEVITPDTESLEVSGARTMRVSLDLSLLESEKVKNLRLFEEIPELEGEHKRSNPFSSYQEESSE